MMLYYRLAMCLLLSFASAWALAETDPQANLLADIQRLEQALAERDAQRPALPFAAEREALQQLQQRQRQQMALLGASVAEQPYPADSARHQSLQDGFDLLLIGLEQSRQITPLSVPLANQQGVIAPSTLLQVGDLLLLSPEGYALWQPESAQARLSVYQPQRFDERLWQGLRQGDTQWLTLDPLRGELLQRLANRPNYWQRLQAGGTVGYITLGLCALGLLLGAWRAMVLWGKERSIRRQMQALDRPSDNPLGRVLRCYAEGPEQSLDAVELRVMEVVSEEQVQCQQGLALIKLFAALSPMLGLLGTVLGMILTFQVVTEVGNADPQVMAGGIATALTTTVLGLLSAMPLLLVHNLLTSQAERIQGVLERQGLGLIATHAERAEAADCKP